LEILPNGYLAYTGVNKIIRFLDSQNDFYDISNNKTFITTRQGRAQLKLLSNNRLASASQDRTLKIWNITDYKLIQTLNMKLDIFSSENSFVLLSEDLLAGAGYNQPIIEIWNITNYKLVKEIDFKDKQVTSLTSLLNKYLVVGFNNNSINIISINYFLLLPVIIIRIFELESIPLKLAFLPNEDLVAITSSGNIYVFDPINNQKKKNFSTEISNIQSLEVINDKYIAVGQRGYLGIYDLFNQELVVKKESTPDSPFGGIYSIIYIKNNNYLVHTTAMNAKNIIFWKIFNKNE
jgi:WD40 repeat protein